MVQRDYWLNVFSHLILILGVVAIALPVWFALVSATHPNNTILADTTPLWFGGLGVSAFTDLLQEKFGQVSLSTMLVNSTIMALGITFGKLFISTIYAYAIVFYRFPGRMLSFWLIFMTLMLPVEVRIVPTFQVIANLNMLNSYTGLTLPLVASAATRFLFRQFFLTIPSELIEAARIDGAGSIRFFFDILLPLSSTNIAALFVVIFVYGWNQYLWPLLITTDESYYTIVLGIKKMLSVPENIQWNQVMAATILAMLPPVIVIITMQRFFVKGLMETEK